MARKKKLGNKDNGFLFAENESPQSESYMILELRQKRRRAADAFDRL